MSQESRRKLLKGLAVTLPAAWTTPMVESIILPAHAQTSPVCDAPEGCYAVPSEDVSFNWPGGAGPHEVDIIEGRLCGEGNGLVEGTTEVVVAEGMAAAREALPCANEEVFGLNTDPPLDNGCGFFACQFVQAD